MVSSTRVCVCVYRSANVSQVCLELFLSSQPVYLLCTSIWVCLCVWVHVGGEGPKLPPGGWGRWGHLGVLTQTSTAFLSTNLESELLWSCSWLHCLLHVLSRCSVTVERVLRSKHCIVQPSVLSGCGGTSADTTRSRQWNNREETLQTQQQGEIKTRGELKTAAWRSELSVRKQYTQAFHMTSVLM